LNLGSYTSKWTHISLRIQTSLAQIIDSWLAQKRLCKGKRSRWLVILSQHWALCLIVSWDWLHYWGWFLWLLLRRLILRILHQRNPGHQVIILGSRWLRCRAPVPSSGLYRLSSEETPRIFCRGCCRENLLLFQLFLNFTLHSHLLLN
jgi:hypothetical protein